MTKGKKVPKKGVVKKKLPARRQQSNLQRKLHTLSPAMREVALEIIDLLGGLEERVMRKLVTFSRAEARDGDE
ncbi:MAG TPA: hypothetical protein VG753_03090 [Candidatus Paceibacterota bacterium]|nr:hypothetical protein [Candidatus Paceibacterota bacterium]